MDTDALRAQLAHLHEELGRLRQADPRSNQLLLEVLKDIQRLLEADHAGIAPGGPPAADARAPVPADRSLSERLEKVAVQFEADHPTFAASSRRLIDLLGKAGL